jgi:predicted SAM-dependent methyltransferase
LPLPDSSVELIYSEDLFDRLRLDQTVSALRECHRVMKPGAVMRVALTDLRDCVLAYLGRWSEQLFVAEHPGIDTPAHMLNAMLRYERQYTFDETDLKLRLQQAGFSTVNVCAKGTSDHADLRGLERSPYSALIVEITK